MYRTTNRNWVRRGCTWKPKQRIGPADKGWAHRTRPKGKRLKNPSDDAPIKDWIVFIYRCKQSGHQLGKLPQHIRRQLQTLGKL